MSRAKCSACGRSVRWSAKRGSRLRDTPCPFCGGMLQGRVLHTATKGKHFGRCCVCGLKRLEGRPCWYHTSEELAKAYTAAALKGGAA